MRLHRRNATSVFALLITFSLSTIVALGGQSSFAVQSVNLTVFRDGLAHVEQDVSVDETYPEISLPLFSSMVENIVVLDEYQKAVDYAFNGSSLIVYTLGATQVSIEYDTTTLTRKDAEVWTLVADNPYNITVLLPKNSTVIYLGQMPNSINTDSGAITLSLFPGHWEISYVLPLIPIEEVDNNGAPPFPIEYAYAAIGIGVVAAAVLGAIFLMRRKKPNVNKIVKTNPQLMPEDKEVLDFLAEKGGKAFEAEIRVRFPNKPRTSLWRLVRRLERLEIVEVKRVGLENQVELKK
jgi:uncharacterized membrane protein